MDGADCVYHQSWSDLTFWKKDIDGLQWTKTFDHWERIESFEKYGSLYDHGCSYHFWEWLILARSNRWIYHINEYDRAFENINSHWNATDITPMHIANRTWLLHHLISCVIACWCWCCILIGRGRVGYSAFTMRMLNKLIVSILKRVYACHMSDLILMKAKQPEAYWYGFVTISALSWSDKYS